MLKLFRKYNQYLLAFGCVILMIAFLLPTMGPGHHDNAGQPIGEVAGRTLTIGDRRQAQGDLQLLQQMGLPVALGEQAELQWMLMLEEARQMGLHASDYEVDLVLGALRVGDAEVQRTSQGEGVRAGYVRDVVRRWALLQSYRQLVLGLGYTSLPEQVIRFSGLAQFMDPGMAWAMATQSNVRASQPARQRLLMDQSATVKFEGVTVPANRVLGEVDAAPEAELQALFDKYKDTIAGEGKPGEPPFGYRTPNRVQIEYLALPLDRARAKVKVDEAEALRFYESNKETFRGVTADGKPGEVRPYAQVRDDVHRRLRDQKGRELADAAMKAARDILTEDARKLKPEGAFREVPQGWRGKPLAEVAQQVQQDPKVGVLMDVVTHGDRWFTAEDLATLPGIGDAMLLLGRQSAPFAAYAMAGRREIAPDVTVVALQAGLPSLPLVGVDGARYVFRLPVAEAAKSPASLDEVRDQVAADAKRLRAFEKLKSDAQTWLALGQSQADFAAVAEQTGGERLTPPALPRREQGPGMQPVTPRVTGIGRSDALLDAVFTKAEALRDQGEVADLPREERVGVAAAPEAPALVIFEVKDYTPISRREFESQMSVPYFGMLLGRAMLSELEADPLSVEALSKRLGYEPEGGQAEEEAGS